MKTKIIGGLMLLIALAVLVCIASTEIGIKEALIGFGEGVLLAAFIIGGISLLTGFNAFNEKEIGKSKKLTKK